MLQLALLILFGVAAVTALVLQAQGAGVQEARERSLVGAETFANAPGTLAAMRSPDPSALLQPRAEAARRRSGVDYIVAFSPAGYRWTHPDPRLIGKHVTGTFDEALAGHPKTSTFGTPVGQAVDSTVPVFDGHGKVVGLVAVGITVRSVHQRMAGQLPLLFGAAVYKRQAWNRLSSGGCTTTMTRCCTRPARACSSSTRTGGSCSPTTSRVGCWGCPRAPRGDGSPTWASHRSSRSCCCRGGR